MRAGRSPSQRALEVGERLIGRPRQPERLGACGAGGGSPARRAPASPGTARCRRRAARRRRRGWWRATSPRSDPRSRSRGRKRRTRPPSTRSSSCSGNSTRAASAALLGALDAAGELGEPVRQLVRRDRVVAELGPAADHRPLDAVEAGTRRPAATRTVNTTAGRGPSGSRLAAASESTGGYSGARRPGRYTVTPRRHASASSGSPGRTKNPTSAIA